MPTGRIIWNGQPGEVWTNGTDRFKYQMVCDLVHTCGVCLQFHLAISNWWPIPFHRCCRCKQIPIKPGQSARPFESFRAILDGLDPVQQTEAIGKSNYRLLKAGVVGWDDIVTETRVRDLQEVVARLKLDVKAMTKAGVSPRLAEQAFARVHTPEQVLIRQHRKELVEQIEKAGLSKQQIAEAVARDIHKRVAIGAGPSKSQAMPPPTSPTSLPPSVARAFRRFATAKPAPKPAAAKPKPAAAMPVLKSPADAIAYGRSLGYDIGTITAEELVRHHGFNTLKASQAGMVYVSGDRRVYVNRDAEVWKGDPAANMAREAKWIAAPTVKGLVDHEIGHAEHHKAVGRERWASGELTDTRWLGGVEGFERRQEVIKAVSGYAATMPVEFVAEVYSGLKNGKAYPGWVMDLYRKLGGPRP